MKKPLLSIGMIFKDDICCIERCLKALEPLRKAISCELVMADTGSTDGSRAVAEQYADQVFDFPWINDFSAARNAVMDRCSGEWYLTVDTDEYLDEDVSQLVHFLTDKGNHQEYGGSVVQRNYCTRDMRSDGYTDFFALRLLRMNMGIRYHGTIHESWGGGKKKILSVHLNKTILHHDGYAGDDIQRLQTKMERNLVLLRAELAKEPDSPRRLIQCQDASVFHPQERISYIIRGMEVVKRDQGQNEAKYQRMVLCRNAVCTALREELPQAEEWLEWAEAHSAETIFFRIDVAAAAAAYFYQKKDYAATLDWMERYQAGCKAYDQGKYNLQELAVSNLLSEMKSIRLTVLLTQYDCLVQLGRKQEALKLAESIDLTRMEGQPDQYIRFLNLLASMADMPEARPLCGRLLASVWDSGEEWAAKVRRHSLNLANELLKKRQEVDAWRLFEQAPGDLGRSICTIVLDEPEQLTAALAQVEKWDRVPMQVLVHAVECCAPLPDSFYEQSEEFLRSMATALGADPIVQKRLPLWAGCDRETDLMRTQFCFQLTAAALRSIDWETTGEGGALLELLLGQAEGYLPTLYHPQVIAQQQLWKALPGLHQCVLYMLQAQQAGRQGDELGYVRSLRAALDSAPAMKGAVDYLLEHKPKTAAQLQLEQLAGQVQAILAQYDPNDPAVTALKASPAYQQVAHLLEPQQAPAPAEEPVSPKPLEEALAGSRKEIEESIRQNIDRWGDQYAKARVGYWEKYPLWGKDKDTVVANMTAALADHGADFRWLFDRLGDEQSRRILTAVVRNWRFFEVEPLGQVVDTTYDDYFDLALLHCDENEVVADLGAFIGDTFLSYVKNYGSMAYRRYYCYEITKESVKQLKKNTAAYPRVTICRKGAGSEPGTMTLSEGSDASANGLTAAEAAEQADTVQIVPLDQDITEPVTLIKMDIEGSEQSALQGCVRHIREDRPKLALSVYHNFEDIWKLPRMIEELVPGYRFYLRYHGGNLWPSEISLLALPPEN